MEKEIEKSWKSLYNRYFEISGFEGTELTKSVNSVAYKLKKNLNKNLRCTIENK